MVVLKNEKWARAWIKKHDKLVPHHSEVLPMPSSTPSGK